MKTIFSKQEEIKVKRGDKTGRKHPKVLFTQKSITNVCERTFQRIF